MTQNAMQVKKSKSFPEQSVLVSSIPSSMNTSIEIISPCCGAHKSTQWLRPYWMGFSLMLQWFLYRKYQLASERICKEKCSTNTYYTKVKNENNKTLLWLFFMLKKPKCEQWTILRFFLKISKFQTQLFLFPFEPKNEWEYFLNFVLASKISQIKRNEGRLSH